jgi:hypothetical protein
MPFVRYLIVLIPAVLALLAAGHISEAQTPASRAESQGILGPQTGGAPFTRTVTITLQTAPESAPALSSHWQISITHWSTADGWDHRFYTLPSDATDITATVSAGVSNTYAIVGNTIAFTFTAPVVDFGYAYRTSQAVLRQGNQYRIDQNVYTNREDRPFAYIGTVVYPSPYQYVGQIGPAPVITTASVHWEVPSVPFNDLSGEYRFSSSMWLVDPRLLQPNLKIVDKDVTIDPQSSIAQVTAQIQNGSSITTGAPVYINLFERQPPSQGPAGPFDMAGGWCSFNLLEQPDCPTFSYALGNTFGTTNALPAIGPLQVMMVTANLTLTQPGYRDVWIQVDAFGGSDGLNRELNEADNSSYVGQVLNPYLIYLPQIVKAK